nr:MAG TPA: hypothetical protein [Bacteriophage sp.]
MIVEIKETETFVPEWNGNKKLPVAEQVSIGYKALTCATRKRIIPRQVVKFEYDKDGNAKGGSGEFSSDPESVIRSAEGVQIENLAYSKAGREIEIRTAAELCSAPSSFYGLIQEFADHLVEKAREEIPEKN